MSDGSSPTTHLGSMNVGLAFSFILLDVTASYLLGLEIGNSLLSSALRCVLQLAIVATMLQEVFTTNNPWTVAGIASEYFIRVS